MSTAILGLAVSVCDVMNKDGIRDMVMSRGLGDVYKRQIGYSIVRQLVGAQSTKTPPFFFMMEGWGGGGASKVTTTVSIK